MKKIKMLLLGICISIAIPTFAQTNNNDSLLVLVELNCQIIDKSRNNIGHPRTPTLTPSVFLDKNASIIYFEDPCYECTLELVISGTDSVAYTYSIPDGGNVVTLPEWLSGQYELHIHRGNFCFWGVIEL